jgi:hypothetical protein
MATLVGKAAHRTSARSFELKVPSPLAASPDDAVPAPDPASSEAEAKAEAEAAAAAPSPLAPET